MAEAMKNVDTLMKAAVAGGIFPGGVLLASKGLSVKVFKAYGVADLSTHKKITRQTVFDLASLTKPLATTLTDTKVRSVFLLAAA